jgi:hypothetical protein
VQVDGIAKIGPKLNGSPKDTDRQGKRIKKPRQT